MARSASGGCQETYDARSPEDRLGRVEVDASRFVHECVPMSALGAVGRTVYSWNSRAAIVAARRRATSEALFTGEARPRSMLHRGVRGVARRVIERRWSSEGIKGGISRIDRDLSDVQPSALALIAVAWRESTEAVGEMERPQAHLLPDGPTRCVRAGGLRGQISQQNRLRMPLSAATSSSDMTSSVTIATEE